MVTVKTTHFRSVLLQFEASIMYYDDALQDADCCIAGSSGMF